MARNWGLVVEIVLPVLEDVAGGDCLEGRPVEDGDVYEMCVCKIVRYDQDSVLDCGEVGDAT